MKINQVAKAIAGGMVAGYAVFQVATGINSPAGEGVTLNEWIAIVATLLVTAASVWAVPNGTPKS